MIVKSSLYPIVAGEIRGEPWKMLLLGAIALFIILFSARDKVMPVLQYLEEKIGKSLKKM